MRYLSIFSLLIYCANCLAQGGAYGASPVKGFTPLENIIFEDNFTGDSLGHFPHKWKSRKCIKDGCNKTHAIVKQEGAEKVLGANYGTYIKPTLTGALTDSFTVEFDFMFKAPQDWFTIAFGLSAKARDGQINRKLAFSNEDQHFSVENIAYTGRNEVIFGYSSEEASYDRVDVPPVEFSLGKWYHLGFSYKSRNISCYLDSTRIFDIADCGYLPFGLFLGLSDSIICKHVVVANGKVPDFSKLLTEKKFVTHSILFASNKAIIGEDSDPFLVQFAKWLLMNPRINIEIDGHTDSVGSAASNLTLSVRRADEIKRHLVAEGVPDMRLTTKGLGATTPLRSNKTDEGKAENRRVEFVY